MTMLGKALLAEGEDSYYHHEAAARRVIAVLLRLGADPNRASYGAGRFTRPLCIAAWKGDRETMRLLLDAGGRINEGAADGYTPLMIAANVCDARMVSLVLARGAAPNQCDAERHTALHYAVASYDTGKDETVRTLIAGGADARLRDNRGDTALAIALRTVLVTLTPIDADMPLPSDNIASARKRRARERQENRSVIALLRRVTTPEMPQTARKP